MKCKISRLWYMTYSEKITWDGNLFDVERRFTEAYVLKNSISEEERLKTITRLMAKGI